MLVGRGVFDFPAFGKRTGTLMRDDRLREAFSRLELLVTVDIYKNETGSLAHYLLPATSPLERADLPFIFPLLLGLQQKPYLQATKRVVRPRGEQRDEATIYLDLCRAAGVGLFGSKIAQTLLEGLKSLASWRRPGEQPSVPQEARFSLLLRLTGQGSFDALLEHAHGRLRDEASRGSAGALLRTGARGVEAAQADHQARGDHAQLVDAQPARVRRG